MSSRRCIAVLSSARPCSRPVRALHPIRNLSPFKSAATFSTSGPVAATPAGLPTQGFRLPRQPRWDEGTESSLDKAGRYFLLTEMLRGMYVVLEQFFRPPSVANPPLEKSDLNGRLTLPFSPRPLGIRYTILLKKVRYRLAFGESMRCDAIRPAKNVALPANYVRLSARHWLSPSRPRSVRTVAVGPPDMILT